MTMAFDIHSILTNAQSFINWANGIIANYGYLGIFFIAFISAATIFLPTLPLGFLVFISGGVMNPLLLGIVAGLGSATGELTGYFFGYEGEKLLLKKYKKKLKHVEKMFQKYGGGIVIIFIASIPIPIIPFDVLGLFCGAVGYDVKKFYGASIIGKSIRYIAI